MQRKATMITRYFSIPTDFVHDDVTRPEGSMGVVVTLKSKMATSSASSEGNSEIIVSFDLSESSNKSPEPLLDSSATSELMSALLPFKFPASGKYNAILDSFVATTTTMHVRAAKVLFYVICIGSIVYHCKQSFAKMNHLLCVLFFYSLQDA